MLASDRILRILLLIKSSDKLLPFFRVEIDLVNPCNFIAQFLFRVICAGLVLLFY